MIHRLLISLQLRHRLQKILPIYQPVLVAVQLLHQLRQLVAAETHPHLRSRRLDLLIVDEALAAFVEEVKGVEDVLLGRLRPPPALPNIYAL